MEGKSLADRLHLAIKEDRIYIARDLLKEAESILATTTSKKKTQRAELQTYFAENEALLKNLREEIDFVTQLLGDLNSDIGWKKAASKKNINVFFKQTEGDPFLTTKVETFVPANPTELPTLFNQMVSLFNETDLLHKWFPRGLIQSSEMIRQTSNFSKLVEIRIVPKIPLNLVLSPRQLVTFGHGFDMSENRSVVITATTKLPGEVVLGHEEFPVPDTPAGFTQFMMQSAYYFELKNNGISFKIIQNLDLNSKIIPPVILNFVSKGTMPFEMITGYMKMLKNFKGSEYEKRIEENPQVYKEVERRLLSFMEKEYNLTVVTQAPDRTDFDESSMMSKSSRISRSRASITRQFSRVKSGLSFKKAQQQARRLSKTAKRSFSKSTEKNGSKRLSKDARRRMSKMSEKRLYDEPVGGVERWDKAREQDRESQPPPVENEQAVVSIDGEVPLPTGLYGYFMLALLFFVQLFNKLKLQITKGE